MAGGICQNPLFASSLEDTFRLTQILMALKHFGTTTIQAHQVVGSCISKITPISCTHMIL